jgi:hypothetical protein
MIGLIFERVKSNCHFGKKILKTSFKFFIKSDGTDAIKILSVAICYKLVRLSLSQKQSSLRFEVGRVYT